MSSQFSRKSFAAHLGELRSRLFWCGIFLILSSGLGYFFHDQILNLLTSPLHAAVFYTSPTGGLDLTFKVSLLFGIVISLPVFIYHITRFIEPAVPHYKLRNVFLFSLSSLVLMILGVGFAYLFGLPTTLNFLNSFSNAQIKPLITTDEYFSFVTTYLAFFGFLFQIPVILLLVNGIKPLKVSSLLKKERYVIALGFILGAAVAPTPDVVSMTIMALPPIILYNLSVAVLWVIQGIKRTKH